MLPDIENIDIMLGTNHFERKKNDFSNSVRRPESPSYNTLGNSDPNPHFYSGDNGTRNVVEHGHNSRGTDSSVEFSRLSGELI